MPAKGTSKQINRNCLVCGETTRIAHLGIDACRACAVFYRRAKKGNEFICRSTTGRCLSGKGINCKRCRFEHIERLIKPGTLCDKPSPSSSNSSTETSVITSSPTAFTPYTKRTELPILERIKTHYRTMCLVRLNSELHARPTPPHPLEISLETGPFFPSTIGSLAVANRIMLTALLEFASSVFPEFAKLQTKERWDLVINNFYRFRIFEGCYRANIIYPDDPKKKFGGYTTWMSMDNMEYFYSDAEGGAKARAMEHVRFGSKRMYEVPAARELLRRVNLSNVEFIVLVAIMFWTIGDMIVRDEVTQLGDRYREAILKELHAYYREELHMDDYATRLGELMMLLPVFDVTHEMKEHFEMLRLLDILTDDNFTYQLQKAD